MTAKSTKRVPNAPSGTVKEIAPLNSTRKVNVLFSIQPTIPNNSTYSPHKTEETCTMISKFILNSMKEFDGYDEERMLFDQISLLFLAKPIPAKSFPVKPIIDWILASVGELSTQTA